ncbi:MAG: hypothetical protein M1483_06770 [Actinobacteria bacterium]|nr:hypothetical protein [Actinomycetota bacterium]MCL6105310.1 hypothetical protein [Actinomycetota bacterium]
MKKFNIRNIPNSLFTKTTAQVVTIITVALLISSCTIFGTPPDMASPSSTVTVSVQADQPGTPINKNLIGVDGPGPSGALSAMNTMGLRWVRTDVSFDGSYNGQPDYNCTTGVWNPASLDSRVQAIKAEGATPELIVDYTPSCLAPATTGFVYNTSYEPPDIGSNKAKWDALVYQMALHEITAEGVRVFEIWNEPDGIFFQGDLAGYLQLYADTSTVLEQAANKAGVSIEVGGPAISWLNPTWMDAFLSYVAQNNLPLNFFSWHFYADFPLFGPFTVPTLSAGEQPWWYSPYLRAQVYGQQAQQVVQELANYPTLHPLLWIDEWNVDSEYDPRQSGPYGAAFAAAVLNSAQTSGIGRMCFFDVADGGGTSPNWGLLYSNFQPKPVYFAFDYWNQMATRQVPISIYPSQAGQESYGQVGAIASAGPISTGSSSGSPTGKVTIYMYNFKPWSASNNYGTSDPTPYDHTINVNINNLSNSTYSWTEQIVDANNPGGGVVEQGTIQGPSTQFSFTLPGEAVALLTLQQN